MKLTKERKVYIAVLGVGLLALTMDRLMFSPAGAAAAEGGALSSPAVAGSATGRPGGQVATEVPPIPELGSTEPAHGLAHRLRTTVRNWEQSIGDAFKPSEEWLPPPKIEDPTAPPKSPAEAFCRAHVLKGLTGNRGPVVGAWVRPSLEAGGGGHPVSGKFIQVGQSLDGWVLVEVNADSAVFEQEGGTEGRRAELRLEFSRVSGVSRRGPEPTQGPPPPESK